MGVYNDIQAALDYTLASYATANTLRCSWPNAPFSPTQGTTWLRGTELPVPSVPLTIGAGGWIEYHGTYQVSLFAPANEGTGTLRTHTDGLRVQFKRGTDLTSGNATVRIDRVHRAAPDIQEENWAHRVVDIEWTCYATNGQ